MSWYVFILYSSSVDYVSLSLQPPHRHHVSSSLVRLTTIRWSCQCPGPTTSEAAVRRQPSSCLAKREDIDHRRQSTSLFFTKSGKLPMDDTSKINILKPSGTGFSPAWGHTMEMDFNPTGHIAGKTQRITARHSQLVIDNRRQGNTGESAEGWKKRGAHKYIRGKSDSRTPRLSENKFPLNPLRKSETVDGSFTNTGKWYKWSI